ncbi:hypothetical protein CAPTEDRAFT_99903, partial [Capitella teleta]
QAKLASVQQERDAATEKMQKLQDELQNLRLYYGLHKALSNEAGLRDDYHARLSDLQEQVKERDVLVDAAQRENARLKEQMQHAHAQNRVMSTQLEHNAQEKKHAQEANMKLERLVNVLRRKITGLGTKYDDL